MGRANDDAALLAPSDQLRHAQQRGGRLRRRIDSDANAWQQWSTTIDETLTLVGQISRTPASNLYGVSVKLDALIWLLTHDDAILDAGAQRRLSALGREVRALGER